MEPIREFLELSFRWPIVPATVLVSFIVLYWGLVILGAMDIDVLDFDLDFDADADSVLGLGWVGLRFLNVGEVPLMLWLSLFGLSWWTFALIVEADVPQDAWPPIVWALVRDVGVALVATKLLTQPLRGRFEHKEPNTPQEMIGRECLVTTSEVTTTFGQAECKTEGAPLLLTIRVREGVLHKGDLAVIDEYDLEEKLYYVSKRAEDSGDFRKPPETDSTAHTTPEGGE